ncbi:hypothetical protein H17ap60334_04882 [Thermosipho africanus H17ap60334]|jgi:hypothetical protein|nr:hypothetical protein H17ap60334_04882 [Thermosipho africanus H17ap60334]
MIKLTSLIIPASVHSLGFRPPRESALAFLYRFIGKRKSPIFVLFQNGSGDLDKELARCGKGAWVCEYQNT